jgi:hypothetical protein
VSRLKRALSRSSVRIRATRRASSRLSNSLPLRPLLTRDRGPPLSRNLTSFMLPPRNGSSRRQSHTDRLIPTTGSSRDHNSFDPTRVLKSGATLVRQWRGHTHTALVREDGCMTASAIAPKSQRRQPGRLFFPLSHRGALHRLGRYVA